MVDSESMRDIQRTGNLWQTSCVENVNTSSLDEDLQLELALVGGGITACSAALRAAELGVSRCLLEAQDIGHGGSGHNVGLVNAGLWTPPDEISRIIGRDAGAPRHYSGQCARASFRAH